MDPALTPSDSEGVRVTGFSEPQCLTCRVDLIIITLLPGLPWR